MIEFYKSRNGWRWRVIARNGKIIGASSEGFISKRNAQDNARLLGAVLWTWDWR